jgi:hypothetical protein
MGLGEKRAQHSTAKIQKAKLARLGFGENSTARLNFCLDMPTGSSDIKPKG